MGAGLIWYYILLNVWWTGFRKDSWKFDVAISTKARVGRVSAEAFSISASLAEPHPRIRSELVQDFKITYYIKMNAISYHSWR